MLSLHATKLVGFGEGGLVIIDKEYEEDVRRACNYGKVGEKFNERSGNYKMSELSAAGILQYWDQFDFKELRKRVVDNYFDIRYKLRDRDGAFWPNWGDDNDDKDDEGEDNEGNDDDGDDIDPSKDDGDDNGGDDDDGDDNDGNDDDNDDDNYANDDDGNDNE